MTKPKSRRAKLALQWLKKYPSYEALDLRSSIVDVITDMKHLAHESGFDLWAIDEIARDHFNAETRNDHDKDCPAKENGPCLCEDPRAALV
jgi:hypothetical protein